MIDLECVVKLNSLLCQLVHEVVPFMMGDMKAPRYSPDVNVTSDFAAIALLVLFLDTFDLFFFIYILILQCHD